MLSINAQKKLGSAEKVCSSVEQLQDLSKWDIVFILEIDMFFRVCDLASFEAMFLVEASGQSGSGSSHPPQSSSIQ